MTQEELIIFWSDKILLHIIDLKKNKYPELTFWLRKQDSERLRKGYWFQGSHYIFVGITNKGDWKNKTRQAGLVFNFSNIEKPNAYFEIAFQSETDIEIIKCYEDIVNKVDGFKKAGVGSYFKYYKGIDFIKIIDDFFDKDWKLFKETIEQFSLTDELIIPETKFKNLLDRTFKVKNNKSIILPKDTSYEPDDEINFWWLNANPKIWSINNHVVGQKHDY